MKKLNINIQVINEYLTNKQLLTLAFYYKLKSLYTYSKIFDYSKNRIAELTGLSVSQSAKYISKLKAYKLAKLENGTLYITGLSTLFKRNPKKIRTIIINDGDTVKSIAIKLKEKLIEENILKQQSVIRKKEAQSKKQQSLLSLEKYTVNNEVDKDLCLSLNGASEILNCSKSSASNFFNKTTNVKMLRRTKWISKCTKAQFEFRLKYDKDVNPGIDFYHKGNHYKNLSSRIYLTRFANKLNYQSVGNTMYYQKGLKFTDVVYSLIDKSIYEIAALKETSMDDLVCGGDLNKVEDVNYFGSSRWLKELEDL